MSMNLGYPGHRFTLIEWGMLMLKLEQSGAVDVENRDELMIMKKILANAGRDYVVYMNARNWTVRLR